jgi:signal transduction histidine kinase
MGIATARERIRAHGGSFEVTSTPGAGTTVEFSLPLPSG